MSIQTATVKIAPAYQIFDKTFKEWGYEAKLAYYLDCFGAWTSGTVTSVEWDGSKLYIIGSVTPPCTGTITGVMIFLDEAEGKFGGTADISELYLSVTANEPYTIYYVETLDSPKTAEVQIL